MSKEKLQGREEAIRKMQSFVTYLDIHSRGNKYICGIKVEFKDKKFDNRGFANLDMSNDSEFGNFMMDDFTSAIKEVAERKLLAMMDEQRELNNKNRASNEPN